MDTQNLTPTSIFNYPPSTPVIVEKMWLRVEPNFTTKAIDAEEQLKLIATQDVDNIELDIGEGVKIKDIIYSSGADLYSNDRKKNLQYHVHEGKLVISLENTIHQDERFHVLIEYTANGSAPGQGFHFTEEIPGFPAHAWTQSESIYARNWFPCIDHPQVKFSREVSVIVPEDYVVISNGELDITENKLVFEGGIKKRFVWEEQNPNPAYLTSIVAGKLVETSDGEVYNSIPLRYYVPMGREQDARRTFKNTSKMLRIFEEYFGVKYPYNKYSQVVALGLGVAGIAGMEHTTCTTLDESVLVPHDAPEDYTTDDVIAHEIAHQWFGDLVTCKDWQDIWLNEGFAAFCEALYFEKSLGEAEYQKYLIQMTEFYISRTKDPRPVTPIRAIVTNKYRHPDDLFDHNTYSKGGIVLHMLRKLLGENDFRTAIRLYLERYQHKNAQTHDFRNILEETSGINLQQFFEQWIHRAGHPILKVKVSDHQGKIKISIDQQQEGSAFVFPLEVRIVFNQSIGDKKSEPTELVATLNIPEKTFSKTFDLIFKDIDHVSIDPDHKILKEFLSIDIPEKFILNQISKGRTIFEKIQASNFMELNSVSAIELLQIKEGIPEGNQSPTLHIEAVKSIRYSNSGNNTREYNVMVELLNKTNDSKIRRTIISTIGSLKKEESFEMLREILMSKNADPYERYFAAIGVAHTGRKESVSLLKSMVNETSFHNLVARGSIEGLKVIHINSTEKLKKEIEEFIIEKINGTKESRLRRTIASSLGNIGRQAVNKPEVVRHLKILLHDNSFHVRNTACVALANALENTGEIEVLEDLQEIMENDQSNEVRKTARVCVDIIKKGIKDQKSKSILTGRDRMNESPNELEDFDLLEKIDMFS